MGDLCVYGNLVQARRAHFDITDIDRKKMYFEKERSVWHRILPGFDKSWPEISDFDEILKKLS